MDIQNYRICSYAELKSRNPQTTFNVVLLSWVIVMVFNATSNYISVISSRSVLLVDETKKNRRHSGSYTILLSSTHSHERYSNSQL